MKKTFAFLLLTGLCGLAFGQTATPAAATVPTFKMGGYISTGVSVLTNSVDNSIYGLYGEENQDYKNGGKYKLTGTWDLNGSGLTFDIQTDGSTFAGTSSSASLYLKYVYAYSQFFNSLITTKAGVIDETKNRTNGDMQFSFTHNVPGAIVIVQPIPGLMFNVAAVNAATNGGSNPNPTTQVAGAYGFLADTQTTAGALYKVPGVGQIMGEGEFVANGVAGGYNLGKAYAGAELTAVPNLDFWFEGMIAGYDGTFSGAGSAANIPAVIGYNGATGNKVNTTYLNDGSNDGFGVLAETISYGFKDLGVAPLTVGWISEQFLYGSSILTAWTTTSGVTTGTTVNPSLRFTPWVSYDLGNGLIPKLAATYFTGAEILQGSYSMSKDTSASGGATDPVLGAAGAVMTKNNVNNIALFAVTPSVKVVLSPTMYMNFVYSYAMSAGSDAVTFLSTNTYATSLQTFQVNYFYTF